ncbi:MULTISPECIES: SDR family NAD(P)-dependent oxidoreductase [Streptacidiphilus]|uniref:SDR family NAD(P)-dependent oxidoreductase n=1 Tax=Streptacidiphilus cavernicola TaxID=3342716 RepID=A0ABV6UL46_9ACTN|nr:SDR family NAD(P)-dependent oxidoreductase [Streptacidiphilus jeojiense]
MKQALGPGRVAVVTGAGSGIGRALADAFTRERMAVVLADIDTAQVEAAAQELRSAGAQVLARTVDVADPADLDRLAAAAVERFGHVDVVCNNAGVSTFNLIQDQRLEDWRWVLGVNLWGVVHGLHSFLPVLRDQATPAHIVNTASIAGLLSGVPVIGPYAASKAAVVSVSESLRAELALAGLPIGVSVLCPSSVDTRVMESERNRPAALGSERRSEAAESMRLMIRGTLTGPTGLSPAAVAERVLAAIREDRFWVITHAQEGASLKNRFADILAHVPPGDGA